MKRGRVITFCGLDCSGKSRIINELYDRKYFRENKQMLFYHPPKEWKDRSDIVATYLDGDEAKISDHDEVIFTSNLRRNIQLNILENLLETNDVIFHRYIYSLYTYYAGSQTLDMDWIYDQTKMLIKPDLVIYLKISLEEFERRRKEKPIIPFQSSKEFVERMYYCYEKLAKDNDWKIVDTEKSDVSDSLNQCIEYIDHLKVDNQIQLLSGKSIDLYELYQRERDHRNG